MKNPLVSVVIPAYNHEKYVGETIQSVLDQTLQDFELIVINDGSTDNTEREILKFEDDRIRYFPQENRGLAVTLNCGIELARGEYFNFLPSDDAFLPEKLETQLKAFEESEEIGVVFSYQHVIDGEGREVKDDPVVDWFITPFETKEEIFPALFERDFLSVPTALIKMECFGRVGLFDESLKTAQDYDLWMRILKYYDLRLIKEPLLKLRWHGANQTYRTTPETEAERAKVLLKAYKNLTIEDIFPSLSQEGGPHVYAKAYEKLADYMEKNGIPAFIPISQIYRDKAKDLINRGGDRFYLRKEGRREDEDLQGSLREEAGKIRLLVETHSLDKGGLEEVVYGITTHLNPALFSPVVVCVERGGYTADRIKRAGIPVEILGEEKQEEYLEILRRYRIDLVNAHYSFLGSAIAHRERIPVISVLHSIYSWYTGSILDEFRKMDRHISKYIAVSKDVASFFEYRFNIHHERIKVVPDGIDVDRFGKDRMEETLNRSDLGFTEDDFIFLHVGAVNPAKMHNLLVAAMKEISKNHPQIKLLCIGQDLNKEYYQFIQEKIEAYSLGQHMRLMGFVENPSPYYRLADAFLLPSLVEGWGIATMEAMVHGLPLILTRVGGAEEFIEDQDIGILIKNCCQEVAQLTASDWDYYSHLDFPSNAPQLIEAMLSIYEYREEWKKKGKKGREKVLSRYTLDKIIPEYEKEFIAFVLEGRKRQGMRAIESSKALQVRLEEQESRLKDQARVIFNQTELFGSQQAKLQEQGRGLQDRARVIQSQMETIRVQEGKLREQEKRLENDARELENQRKMIHDQLLLTNTSLRMIGDQLIYIISRLSLTERLKGLRTKLKNKFGRLFRFGPRDPLRHQEVSEKIPPGENCGEQPARELKKKILSKEIQAEECEERERSLYSQERGGFSIICLPIIDWDFRFQRPQQILSKFARDGHRVFYVKTQCIPKESKNLSKNELTNFLRIEKLSENIYQVPLISHHRLNIYQDMIEDKTDLEYLKWSIEILRERAQIENIVFYVNLPFWFPLVSLFSEEPDVKIVYDCMDYHPGFSTNTGKMVDQEETLSKLSDLVIASSRKLYQLQSRFNPRSILVQNGTDFDHFSSLEPKALPDNIRKPIIGYYGAISDWFDMELIRKIALARPDWSWVLIGHTFGAQLDLIKGIPNIHLFGERHYRELPGFLYHFDVCTIPFKVNQLTEATNPVKVYEYLSAGKPVVATKLPELEPLAPYIYIAGNLHDFINQVEVALVEKDENLKKRRVDFARQNDWVKRYEAIYAGIRRLYEKVSILITSFNNLEYLKLCMQSIFEYSDYPNYEVIVIDNGSKDGSPEYLRKMGEEGKIKVILNPQNLGFAKANNQGIEIASGETIILLNDDTVVTQNWIGSFLRYLSHPGVGMVGPVSNEVGNEAKIATSYSSLDEMREWAKKYTREHKNETHEIKMLALFCVALKRSLLNEIGGLDERFEIGMFEDDDFSLRVKKAGYKTICAEDVFIHHFGRVSFRKMEAEEYRKLFDRNRKLFERKWNIKWEPHRYREKVRKAL